MLCNTCGLCVDGGKYKPIGNMINPSYIVLTDAPDVNGTPFTEDDLQMLIKLGLDLDKCCVICSISCTPYYDRVLKTIKRTVLQEEYEYCKGTLLEQLSSLPNVPVVTMGDLVFSAFTQTSIARNIGKRVKVTLDLPRGSEERVVIKGPHQKTLVHSAFVMNKMKMIFRAADNIESESDVIEHKILNPVESIELMSKIIQLYQAGEIEYTCFDEETTGLSHTDSEIIMISLCHPADRKCYSIPLIVNNQPPVNDKQKALWEKHGITKMDFEVSPVERSKITRMIIKLIETVPIAGHNLKFDSRMAIGTLNASVRKIKIYKDTMIDAHNFFGRKQGFKLSLKDLSKNLFNVEDDWDVSIDDYMHTYSRLKDRNMINIPTSLLGRYAALDVYYTRELIDWFSSEMAMNKSYDGDKKNIDNPISIITRSIIPFTAAEVSGIKIDENMNQYLDTQYKELSVKTFWNMVSTEPVQSWISTHEEVEKLMKKGATLKEAISNVFNPNSTLVMKTLLYDKKYFGFPILKDYLTPKKEPQTGKEVLELFAGQVKSQDQESDHFKFLDNCLLYKKLAKLMSTYMTDIGDKMMYPDFNLIGTVTGRLSSGFHTMPRESDIKRKYISRWSEGGLFMCADLSQIELRIIASLANEQAMINTYIRGEDLHARTASGLFKKPIDSITGEERAFAKQVNFGIVYQQGAGALSASLNCSQEKAQEMIDNLYSAYPKLREFVDNQMQFVRSNGYIVTPFGRVIDIEEIHSFSPHLVADGERKSVNFPVQSAASDLLQQGNTDLFYNLSEEGMSSIFIGNVHDSIEYDVYPGELFTLINKIKYYTETRPPMLNSWLKTPIVMDISIGYSWGGCLDCDIEEMTDTSMTFKTKALRKDIRQFISHASKAYNVEHTLISEKPTKDSDFSVHTFVKDGLWWTSQLKISKK